MTDEDLKKISKAFDERLKLLLAEITRVKHEITDIKSGQFNQYTELSKIGKDIIRIDSTLETIAEESGKQGKKLGILWEQVEKVTFALDEIKETLDSQSETLKRREAKTENNTDNIHKLNKRVSKIENNVGICSSTRISHLNQFF